VSLHGRHLVLLIRRLDDLEAEVINMVQWADREGEGGNSRTSALLDAAAVALGGAARQAQRDIEAEAARVAQEQAQARWNGDVYAPPGYGAQGG
jgi:hypothetical protein